MSVERRIRRGSEEFYSLTFYVMPHSLPYQPHAKLTVGAFSRHRDLC
jgi:hypothetical protein